VLYRRLCHEKKTKHIDIKLLVEILLRDGVDRSKFVDAGVIYKNVELPVVPNRGIDNTLCFGSL
jgi:hypothetical protein